MILRGGPINLFLNEIHHTQKVAVYFGNTTVQQPFTRVEADLGGMIQVGLAQMEGKALLSSGALPRRILSLAVMVMFPTSKVCEKFQERAVCYVYDVTTGKRRRGQLTYGDCDATGLVWLVVGAWIF